MEKQKPGLSSSFYTKLYLLLGAAIIILFIYNNIQVAQLGSSMNQKLVEAEESARPAELKLVTIVDNGCKDCFGIASVVESIKKANVNITEEKNLDLSSEEARELIGKYNIAKIPAVLLYGELDKVDISLLERRDDALLFTGTALPYTDALTRNVLGRVSVTVVKDSSCEKCTDTASILDLFKQLGIKIVSESVIERSSGEGKGMIKDYSLKVLPTLIFSKDLGMYSSDIVKNWGMYGSVEADGSYVLRDITPPYINLTENRVQGLVSMTHILDEGCEGCYSTSEFQKPVLERMGVVFGKEENVSLSSKEGKYLVEKYSITKVPTIILEGDMGEYSILVSVWKDVGTVEPDGTYVFRKIEVANKPYKDLATGKIVAPSQPAAA